MHTKYKNIKEESPLDFFDWVHLSQSNFSIVNKIREKIDLGK